MVNNEDKIKDFLNNATDTVGSGRSHRELILEAIKFGKSLNNTITIDRYALERLIKHTIKISSDGSLHYDEIFEIIKRDFGINL